VTRIQKNNHHHEPAQWQRQRKFRACRLIVLIFAGPNASGIMAQVSILPIFTSLIRAKTLPTVQLISPYEDQELLMPPEILRLPNLLSLSRIALAPVIGYFISRGDQTGNLAAIGLLILAGITDGLDGYLARRWHQVSSLGIALDPIADKILAAILVIFLILYRGFPVWLAVIIVGRDLVIMAAGLLLMQERKVELPSNLTGKYAFAAIVVLLTSYLIRFQFGIVTSTYLTLALIAASLVNYGHVFMHVRKGLPPPEFRDQSVYQWTRRGLTIAYFVLLIIKLYSDVIRP
jgi:CDP-diacylglycerol--glycerol-3-phosphate 3-phosphatidyltransferase